MDKSELLKLAERVEALSGPDVETDLAIAVSIGAVPEAYERAIVHGKPMPYYWHSTDTKAGYWTPLEYTGSLDAAMTLVPEDHIWAIEADTSSEKCGAWCYDKDCQNTRPHLAATPALAFCAAALRALAKEDS